MLLFCFLKDRTHQAPVLSPTGCLLPRRRVSPWPLRSQARLDGPLGLPLSSPLPWVWPKHLSHLVLSHCPTHFRTSSNTLWLWESLRPPLKALTEELNEGDRAHCSSSREATPNRRTLSCKPPAYPVTAEGLFPISASLLWEKAPATPRNQTQLWPVATVSNFETGLLQNVQFQAPVRLPASCPNFLGEWDLFKEGIKSPCSFPWVKTCSIPGKFQGLRLHLLMSHRQKAEWSCWRGRPGLSDEEELFLSAKDPSSLPGMESGPQHSLTIIPLCTHSSLPPTSVLTRWSATLHRFSTGQGVQGTQAQAPRVRELEGWVERQTPKQIITMQKERFLNEVKFMAV